MTRLSVLLVLLLATPAMATDYYVRTDGNDSNTGLSNTAGGAWLSPSKCAALPGGNRCRIQPGTYYVTAGITQANSGSLKGNDVATCTCTKGSTTISCTSAPAVTAGDWVRCDASGSYFNWARVGSVVGTTINLESAYLGDGGYLGESTGGTAFLDVASMVEVVGDGSIGDIIISQTQAKPGGVTWTQSGTYSDVWSYLKSTGTGAWANPQSFRQTTGTWDKWYVNRDGQDTFIALPTGSLPCSKSTCEEQVHTVSGSWCDDGTRIWVQAFRDADPNTVGLRASNATLYSVTWTMLKDYTVIRNLYFDTTGYQMPYNTDMTMSFRFGGSNSMIKDVTALGATCQFDLGSNRTRMEVRGVDCLHKANTPEANTTHSGLRFYDLEVRGGLSNAYLSRYMRGASPTDRVMFDRFYIHRTFNYYASPYTYDCTAGNFTPATMEQVSGHATDFGLPTEGSRVANIIVQNSIVELTADGFTTFNGGDNVTYRNCTMGVSHSMLNPASTRQEVIRFGASPGSGNITSYNNLFYVDETTGALYNGAYWNYSDNWNTYVGDYNLYLHPYNLTGGSLNAATTTETFKGEGSKPDYSHQTMITSLGQETHSMTVCYGGCTAANATVYNDGTVSREYFIKPYVNDGTISNYTPVVGKSRAINAGLNAQCPTEDFYGNPRNDGQCDIGAVELQGGVEPAGPHRTDIRPGTILR